jgi:hypothetical protein
LKFRALIELDGNKVVFVGQGEGGITEMKEHLKDDKPQFGYVRVVSGDSESKRTKFVFVSWAGEKVGALKRAKMSVQKADVKKHWKVICSIKLSLLKSIFRSLQLNFMLKIKAKFQKKL